MFCIFYKTNVQRSNCQRAFAYFKLRLNHIEIYQKSSQTPIVCQIVLTTFSSEKSAQSD